MNKLGLQIQENRFTLSQPITTARGLIHTRDILQLRLTHPDGFVGLGEASPLPDFSIEDIEECRNALHEARDTISCMEPSTLWQSIALASQTLALPAAAQHAVEEALWNLSAAMAPIDPVQMLSHTARSVPLHRLVQDAETAKAASLEGYTEFKVKVGHEDIAKSMQRIRAIAQSIPTNTRIRLDANGGWDASIVSALSEDLLNFKVWCIEEPVSGLHEMAALRSVTTLKILADESLRTVEDLNECLALNAAHGVVLKPMLVGGPLTTYALAQQAIEAGLLVSVTTTFDGPLARASACRIASAIDSPQLVSCGLETGRFFSPPQSEEAQIVNGTLTVHSETRSGIEGSP